MRSKLVFIVLITVLLASVACSTESGADEETETAVSNDGVLVLGDISDEAAETIAGTQPLADYLTSRLGEQGIGRGEVKIASDLDGMVEWMSNGEVDIYFDSPYPILVLTEETGGEPVLSRLKYGVAEYHSVFFTRADSDIDSLDDLKGQIISFEEDFSTSGYMLPLSYLIETEMNPAFKTGLDADVSDDEIGYVFSTADDTTIQWVISGKVPAGVIDNVTLGRLPEETQAELKVIAETENVPRQMVLLRPGMDEALQTAIINELLIMDENEEGANALEIFLTTEFTEFPEGADATLSRMLELYRLVESQ